MQQPHIIRPGSGRGCRRPPRRAWGTSLLCVALLSSLGCRHHEPCPQFILPEEAAIARSAAYAAVTPPYHDGARPPMPYEMGPEIVFPRDGRTSMGTSTNSQFSPLPNYFPEDGPQLQPAPGVEFAPSPIPSDIEQMGGVYCCQRCQRLTEDLQQMSERVDELSAMMETQRLTIESLNAALLRADANIQQLHDDVAWHRGELDRVRTMMEEQQRRDHARLREIAEIVERLSATP